MSNSVGYTQSNTFVCLEDLEQITDNKISHPLSLLYCGKEECQPGWQFGPYVRENYVIHIVTDGSGTYTSRGKEFRLSAGEAFIIYPGEETTYVADQNSPWTYMWIGFNGLNARRIVEEIGFTRDEPVMPLSGTEAIGDAINKMLDARELTYIDGLKRTAALYEVLAAIMESCSCESPQHISREAGYVNMAIDLIVSSYDGQVRIADIAARVGINRSYLTNIFRQEMHMSPQEFLINYRLEKAAQLLRSTDEPIGSIASSVGYTDPLAFSKAFRKKYSSSPSDYRRNRPVLSTIEERGGYISLNRL